MERGIKKSLEDILQISNFETGGHAIVGFRQTLLSVIK